MSHKTIICPANEFDEKLQTWTNQTLEENHKAFAKKHNCNIEDVDVRFKTLSIQHDGNNHYITYNIKIDVYEDDGFCG